MKNLPLWLETIAVFIPVVLSLIAIWKSITVDKRLKRYEADLQDDLASKKALRDYRYDALKRIYRDGEPMLFQLIESIESTEFKIRAFARDSKRGELLGFSSDVYHQDSAVYRIFAPCAFYQSLRRTFTILDLSLDPYVAALYSMLKVAYFVLTDHYRIAALEPAIEYRGNYFRADKIADIRQGVLLNQMDNIAEKFLAREQDRYRVIAFDEFQRMSMFKTFEKSKDDFALPWELFYEFTPQTRPVLWRELIIQATLYAAMRRVNAARLDFFRRGEETRGIDIDPASFVQCLDGAEREQYYWLSDSGAAGEDMNVAFRVAQAYLKAKFPGEVGRK